MGYTVAVSTKSPKSKAKLLAFFAEHYRPWHQVSTSETAHEENVINPDYDYTRSLRGEGLSYNGTASKVGFDYSVSQKLWEYMIGILRWSALRVGRTRRFKAWGVTDTSVPYTCYDYEAWPVLVRERWEEAVPEQSKQWLVDELGFKPANRFWSHWEEPKAHEYRDYIAAQDAVLVDRDRLVRAELERLNQLWEAAHGPQGI